MISNTKDFLAGLLFMAIAAAFGVGALNYSIGSAFRMGPGYFPLLLSGVLGALGLLIVIRSFSTEGTPLSAVSARGLILVLAAPLIFGLTLRGLGFVPSVAIVVMFGALASRKSTIYTVVGSMVVLTLASVAIFKWGLGVPFLLFGPWLDPITALFAQGA